jgi:hypothetical protein
MARYGKETTLGPRRVLRLARSFFGPEGELGLEITKDTLNEIGFDGGGGSVEVTALPRAGDLARTDVTILSREFDLWAERFLGVLSDEERGPGPGQRLTRWIKGVFNTERTETTQSTQSKAKGR